MFKKIFFYNIMFFSIVSHAQHAVNSSNEIKVLPYILLTPFYFFNTSNDNEKWICTPAGAGMTSHCWKSNNSPKNKNGDD